MHLSSGNMMKMDVTWK